MFLQYFHTWNKTILSYSSFEIEFEDYNFVNERLLVIPCNATAGNPLKMKS
jgi:hypothetical protein